MAALELLFRNLEARDELSNEEKALLSAAVSRVDVHGAGELIVAADAPQTSSRVLLSGLAARAKTLADGGRQITELHIPGDFLDLHSFGLKRLEHDVTALAPSEVAVVPHEALRRVTETQPHLTRVLWLSTLLDASIHREWIVSSGRRSAVRQVAHLFCELLVRHEVVGLSDRRVLPLPLTQQQLSDVCGLSPVHVNRVLGELRQAELAVWGRTEVTVPDFDRLAAFAQFDPDYLVLRREPR